jgi:hypothetical protein
VPSAPPVGAVLIAPGPAVGTTPPHAR